ATETVATRFLFQEIMLMLPSFLSRSLCGGPRRGPPAASVLLHRPLEVCNQRVHVRHQPGTESGHVRVCIVIESAFALATLADHGANGGRASVDDEGVALERGARGGHSPVARSLPLVAMAGRAAQ